MHPTISIITPCYNQAEYLPETLQSVLDQEYPYWECLIINDGSPDNTEEIALEWCAKDSRFKYLYKENSGVSDTRNYGIKHAIGDYILPLDGDDLIDKLFLSEAISVFQKKPETKLVYSNVIEFGERNTKQASEAYSFEKMLSGNLISATAVFRKIDFEKTAGYNTNMENGLEDWDFWLSFLLPNDMVIKLEGFYLRYRIKQISRSTLIDKEKNEKLILQIFKNHISLFLEHFNPIRDHIEADYYKKRTSSLLESTEHRIGKLICSPFKLIKKFFGK